MITTTTRGAGALLRPEARTLPAYRPGPASARVQQLYGLASVTRLGSNESPYGPSPRVGETLLREFAQMHRYPDPQTSALRESIERIAGIPAERVIFGNGSEDVIRMICLALIAPGDRVVTLAPSFALHEIYPMLMGAAVEKVRVDAALGFDIPAWRQSLARPAKLVIFSNPANPVGCALTSDQFRAIVESAPSDALIAVDEAYYEYAAGTDYADSIALLSDQRRPWIVLRTLSKAYGLAGLRVGYGISSDCDLVSVLNRVRTPFPVSGAAQSAALAALSDQEHLRTVVSATRRERETLVDGLRGFEHEHGHGLRIAPSSANFVFVDIAMSGQIVAEELARRGVIVKAWQEAGFESFLRISVGDRAENAAFLGAFADVMARSKAGGLPGAR